MAIARVSNQAFFVRVFRMISRATGSRSSRLSGQLPFDALTPVGPPCAYRTGDEGAKRPSKEFFRDCVSKSSEVRAQL